MSLKKGTVTVAPGKKEYRVDLERMRKLVTEGGATLHSVDSITATGMAVKAGGRTAFKVGESGQVLELENPEKLAPLLEKNPDAKLRLTGPLSERTEGNGAEKKTILVLRVEQAEPAEAGAPK